MKSQNTKNQSYQELQVTEMMVRAESDDDIQVEEMRLNNSRLSLI